MQRFFLASALPATGGAVDLSPLRHQLQRVLRARPGDRILLLDGNGFEYVTELEAVDGRETTGRVLERRRATGEPRSHVTLWQCALKADKMEWVLQKGTELGVSRFVPVISQRTIVRPASALLRKYERWRTIVREAAEQSGRGLLPELAEPLVYAEAVRQAHGVRLLPWEEAGGAPSLSERFVRAASSEEGQTRIDLLIGPEGGLSAAEAQEAAAAGWQMSTLGPRTLRAETAALAAVAVVMALAGEMGPGAPPVVGGPTAGQV